MKVIVILMKNVKLVLYVDQTIAQVHLVLFLKLIVVINQLLEIGIFVHLEFLVGKMKEIVILLMSVKMVLFVDQTIAQGPSVLTQKLIVVVPQVTLENCENAWAIAFIEHDYCSGHRK